MTGTPNDGAPSDRAPNEPAPNEPAPNERAPARRWRRTWPLVALAALALGEPEAAPEGARPGDAPPEAARPAVGPTARLTLELGASDPPGQVEVSLYLEGEDEPYASHRGALPVVLEVPRGRALRLVAQAPGRARHVAELTLEGDRTARVPLPPGERLAGRVVNDAGGAVEGAELTLVRDGGPSLPWTARAGSDGSFVVDTLLPGRYEVRASAAGHAARSQAGVEPGADLRLALERVGLVSGRVVGPDGAAAPGATLVIAGSGIWPARAVMAGEDGRFRIDDVPPGVYEVRAHHGALVAPPRRGLTVEPGSPVYLTFALTEGVVLRGIVRDSATGRPVAGAQVTASAEALDVAPAAATTDEGGRFTVRGLAHGALLRVSVFAEGYVPRPALEHPDASAPLEVELEPGGTLAGLVLDEHRQPIEGARIEVLGEGDDRQPVALGEGAGFRAAVFAAQLEPAPLPAAPGALEVVPGPVPAIPLVPLGLGELPFAPLPPAASEVRLGGAFATDRHGGFRVTGVPPGHVQVVARHAGRASASTARLYVASGAVRDDIELVLLPAGSLRVAVRDERGAGVEAVLVEARSDREPFPRVALTDDRGELALDGLAGEVTVTATPRGRPAARATVTVAPGQRTEIELALEGELHTLSGRVVDEDGYPVPAVTLGVASLRAGAPHRRTFFAAADGTFALSELPAPPWRVEASDPRYAPAAIDVVSSAGEARVVLARGARVTGSVLDDARGVPLDARVTLERDALPPEVLETRAGEDGFAFARVRAGRWRLRIEAEDHLAVERDVEVVDRGRGPDDLDLDPIRLAGAGRLEGTVVDALGAPVARARVFVDEGPSTETDARGEFVLRGLSAGTMIARASHPAAGEGETGTVRVLAGRETPGLVVRLSERFDPERAAALPGRRRGVAVIVASARGAVRVQHVVAESRAARAGLREGDVLESIDDVAPESGAHATRLLRGAPGVPAIVAVRRGEERGVLVVERESWLPPAP